MRTPLLVTGVALVALLAGCAQAGTGTAAGDTPTPSSSSVLPSGGYTTTPGPSKSAISGQRVTVTGTVMAGAEAKCLVLKTEAETYLLLGGDPAVIHEDAHITVTGVVRTDVMSYCMQGIPLEVEKASPA